MNIIMAGIDHKTANVHIRSVFSLSSEHVKQVSKAIFKQCGISGVVLLSTCNRTELYLSYHEELPNPVDLLCEALRLCTQDYASYFVTRVGHQAVMHLMMVSAGLRSQILGEDQIITQVGQAIDAAREAQVSNSLLETIFRNAITAGKRVKTHVPLSPVPLSSASQAVETLQQNLGTLAGKDVLIIGNGQMGRLTAELLLQKQCTVTITLRTYRQGETIVPSGCKVIPYPERYMYLHQYDILIGATISPHFVITLEKLKQCPTIPHYMVDLALPRDMEPGVEKFSCYWGIDDLVQGHHKLSLTQANTIRTIILEQIEKLEHWFEYKSKYCKHY